MDRYDSLKSDILSLMGEKNLDHHVYGKSFLGENLYVFHKGSYKSKQLLITASMHAREYISCKVVLNLIKDYKLNIGCYFFPLVNPDGVKLVLEGNSFIKDDALKSLLLRLNHNSQNFSLWKANARGVDLNVNFNAMWGKGKFVKKLPGPSGYVGEYPNSEIENKCLLNFIQNKDFYMSIAYHSKGNVVYYGFEKLNKKEQKNAKKIAKTIAKHLKYKTIQSKGSTGGLSDYLSYVYKIPSFTIELGDDNLKHPISLSEFDKIYKNQYDMLKKIVEKYGSL